MKRLSAFLLAALMLLTAAPFTVMAEDTASDEPADLPYITSKSVAFIANSGSDDATGASATSAKKSFGTLKASGAVGLLSAGGTLVVSGKGYLAADYTLPKLSSPLLITSVYAGVDYQNAEPANNPACAFKMKGGKSFTIQSDVIIDDIIMFQESATETAFVVDSGATLVIGAGVTNMSNQTFNIKIKVNAGGRLIVGGGDFDIENNGGEVIEDYTYNYLKVTQGTVVEDNSDLINVPPQVCYISFNSGKNSLDGLTQTTPKKQMLSLNGNGALSVIAGGGTLVVTGRLFISNDYTIPKLGSYLTITGEYGMNFVDPTPETNPSGGTIKLGNGKTLTVATDARIDDIIFFQEGSKQVALRISGGATVTIGKDVICMTKQVFTPKIIVDAGSTLILEDEDHGFDSITGDGTVIMADTQKKGFEKARAYDGRFTDIADKWFYEYVKTAYEYTLANGTSATKFSPDNTFTVAQALTVAANMHIAYNGGTLPAATGAWYMPYVNYCIQNGIITSSQFANYDANITRGDMAVVFANVLPDSEYEAVKEGSNPDVTSDMACAAAVAKLYKAGIVGGDAGTGNYRPNDSIKRSEACVIFSRIAAPEYRAQ